MCTPSVPPSAQTPGQKLIVKSKCRAEFQATPSSQNLIIPQHFDSFVVRPSRRPIDGRGQKLDIELECPGRQINDSLTPQFEAGLEPGQNGLPACKAFGLGCRRADKMTYCIPLSLSLSSHITVSGNVYKVHKCSTRGASLWLVNFTTRFH